jgi:murein DD-endopeptidase MepM/ murein hydrolase activator NlpD
VLVGSAPAIAAAASAPPPPAAGGSTTTPVTHPGNPWVVVLSSKHAYLRRGDSGTAVAKLQKKLRALHQRGIAVNGTFGATTWGAVRTLQRRYHQHVSGVAGVAFLTKVGLTVKITTPVVLASSSASGVTTAYLRTFPIRGTTAHPYSPTLYPYSDVWHTIGPEDTPIQGAELPAALGTTVVSACNGTVIQQTPTATGVGGWWIEIEDTTGTTYWYSHLNSYARGIHIGAQVATGQPIGTVGNSGDAAGGPPYLYLEVDRGGSLPVDPFRDLNLLEPTVTGA